MDMPAISLVAFQAFLVCLARVAAMMAALPVYGGGQVPVQVKVGLTVMIALVIFPVVQSDIPTIDFHPVSLGVLMAGEAMLGAAIGFIGQLVFTAVEFGAAVIGYKMGFAAANIFDPTNQQQVQLLSQFQGVLAILLFFAFDAHHLFFRALVHSYQMLPPGTADFSGGAIPLIMELTSQAFLLGLRISAPILAILILTNLILGVMARVFPQLNVFILSFPINIGIAFILMGLTFQVMATLLGKEFGGLEERLFSLFQALRV